MQQIKQMLAIIGILFTSLTALSYEQDTHLRLTYLIARSVGINDEVSKFLAYGNQNIDQTAISTAMMTPAQRGLFHFTGSLTKIKSDAHGGDGPIERIGGLKPELHQPNI